MSDESYYQMALQEFDEGKADEALLAKAWVHADGDDARKKIEYVKLRVAQLKTAGLRRTAAAAGTAAKIMAPSLLDLAVFIAKIIALMLVAAACVAVLAQLTGEPSPGKIVGSVLGGILAIYPLSRLIEWALLKRMVGNRRLVVVLSNSVSFLLILALWFSGRGKPYAMHPDLLFSVLLASLLLILARTFLPGKK